MGMLCFYFVSLPSVKRRVGKGGTTKPRVKRGLAQQQHSSSLAVQPSVLASSRSGQKHAVYAIPGTALGILTQLILSTSYLLIRGVLLQSSFYKWVNWGTERFNCLPKVTQLANRRAGIWAQVVWLQSFHHKLLFAEERHADRTQFFSSSVRILKKGRESENWNKT